jgi:protein SCO1/2
MDDATRASGRSWPRSLLRSPFFWAALGGLIAIPAMRPLLRYEPAPPPVLYRLPPFSLIDTRGEPFGSAQLEGQVYVADFIFTRCGSICPLLTRAMSRLDRRYRESGVEGVRLVSITVDPQFDTPQVLSEYGAAHGIDAARWSLLTGPPETIRSLITGGFLLAPGDATQGDAHDSELIDIAHTGKLVLVDQRGGVRGLYDIDEAGLDEVYHRSRHVVAEGRR